MLNHIAVEVPATKVAGLAPPQCPLVVTGAYPELLHHIIEDRCVLAIWQRRPNPGLTMRLSALDHGGIADIDETIPLADAMPHVALRLGAAGYMSDVGIPLARDIVGLATLHAAIGGWQSFRLRLEWIETDGCRKFHTDVVTTRLLTTYLGRGTQWRRAGDPDSAAAAIDAGSVAVFKGLLLAPDAPILHRSPPLAGTGERRLLLALDPVAPSA